MDNHFYQQNPSANNHHWAFSACLNLERAKKTIQQGHWRNPIWAQDDLMHRR